MARLPYPEIDTLPAEARQAVESLSASNIFKMLGHAPGITRPFLMFGNTILNRLALNPRWREMAILTTARLGNANYEWAQHVTIAKACGVEDDIIAAIKAEEWTGFSDDDSTIVTFALEVARDVRASDEAFQKALQLLGTEQLMELLFTVGYYGLVARFLETTDVDLEPENAIDTLR